jgi:hypothetical protein
MLNMQRELQLQTARQAQRSGTLQMLAGLTQGPVPGAFPSAFGGGGLSAGAQAAGAGGQILGGLLPLLLGGGGALSSLERSALNPLSQLQLIPGF